MATVRSAGFRRIALIVAASLVAGGILLGVARWMTGPAPKPAAAGAPTAPPPLVLRDGATGNEQLAAAASSLAAGDAEGASRRFADLSAQDPVDPVPQVGLALSRWSAFGADRVQRDLEQLAREYTGDPYVLLHVGLVQAYARRGDHGQAVLRQARAQAREQRGQADIARRADDLLHPALAPGYPPLLVQPGDCRTRACARLVSSLRQAVGDGDRLRAARLAQQAPRNVLAQAPAAIAVAMGAYDKDDPEASVDLLDRTAREPAVLLHRALLHVWNGHRDAAIRDLRAVADDPASRGTRWQRHARAILERLA